MLERRVAFAAFPIVFATIASAPSQAYFGPGAGLSLIGSFLAILAALIAVLCALVFWPIRRMLKGRKQKTGVEAGETTVRADAAPER